MDTAIPPFKLPPWYKIQDMKVRDLDHVSMRERDMRYKKRKRTLTRRSGEVGGLNHQCSRVRAAATTRVRDNAFVVLRLKFQRCGVAVIIFHNGVRSAFRWPLMLARRQGWYLPGQISEGIS